MEVLQKLQGGINYILNLDKNNFLKHAVVFLNVTNEVSGFVVWTSGINYVSFRKQRRQDCAKKVKNY